MLLDIADIDSRLILTDKIDELLFDRIHPVHAAVLDLLLMDFREISTKETKRSIWVNA